MSSPPAIGASLIQEQHDMLARRLRGIRDAAASDEAPESVATRIADLTRYLRYHFDVEEEIMRTASYPRREEHQDAHASFRRKVDELHGHIGGTGRPMVEVLLRLLEHWLQRHDEEMDQGLLHFLADHDSA